MPHYVCIVFTLIHNRYNSAILRFFQFRVLNITVYFRNCVLGSKIFGSEIPQTGPAYSSQHSTSFYQICLG